MKTLLLFVLIFLTILSKIIAQSQTEKQICGTDVYMEELFKQYPELKEQIHLESINRDLTPYKIQRRESVRIIPVVFHIIHEGGPENIPDENIYAVLKRINEDFRKLNSDTSQIRDIFKGRAADMNIEFRLARIDPEGKCTRGINRIYSTLTENARDNVKNLIGWDNMKYLNIWVVKSINNPSGEGTILGYSYYPQAALQNPKLDGIVIRADVTNYTSRTLSHELGHYFGLPHTFQGGCGGDCKTTGDYICDTPPVLNETYGCDKTKNSCNNDFPDEPDMSENHMDYTNCRVMFTNGQKEVVDYYLNSQYRSKLWQPSNLAATGVDETPVITCKPVASFDLPLYAFCVNSPVILINNSLGPEDMQFTWYLPGSSNPVINDKNPVITYSEAGKYNVKLKVKSSYGSDSIEKTGVLMIYPAVGENVTFTEDFEGNEFKSPFWYIEPNTGSVQWKRSTAAKYEGSKSYYLNNFSYSSTEKEFYFILPPLNLSQVTAPYLYFAYAHARKNENSKDLLRIYVSVDCGKNWSLRDITNHLKLPTTENFVTTQFIPAPGQWREKLVDLTNYQGKENVLIKIGFYAAGGNNFFIDNLKVYSSAGIAENQSPNYLNIYPNPASGHFAINFFSDRERKATIIISNISGQIVFKSEEFFVTGENSLKYDISTLQNDGIYFITLFNEDLIIRKTIILIRNQ